MDLKRKLDNLEMYIASISTHTDEDAAVRHAFLDEVAARVQAHKDQIRAEVAARIAAAMNPGSQGSTQE